MRGLKDQGNRTTKRCWCSSKGFRTCEEAEKRGVSMRLGRSCLPCPHYSMRGGNLWMPWRSSRRFTCWLPHLQLLEVDSLCNETRVSVVSTNIKCKGGRMGRSYGTKDGGRAVLADDTPNSTALKLRANTIRGLADLLNGEIEPAKSFFEGFEDCNVEAGKEQVGNAMLSYGEFLHCTGNILLAKDTYEKSLRALENENLSGTSYKAAANMVPEEALLGVSCALGQLLSHSGKFNEAEELLTKALTKAEHHFGSSHPKVGIILTCIGLMFKQKAKSESSSSILVQEGLYRRALDLLKAPTLNSEVTDPQGDKRDIVALARGGYAELLCIQQNRKEEGERMKKWAEAAWRNRRLSLAEALDFSEPSKAAVVDTRICRLL
ncbi:uncharacterized protein LOC109727896 isoform X2 [Ananas comosus]|uniref:Uncharacterized protein LOC109727896 isoform X2 n=1 Tax=Ananas comosus TaxID=4615 RepID=A0A6P5H0S8_ANACO|nr:uncharacterized protein LOC109727896 isoform X2 [Ananas comosus]